MMSGAVSGRTNVRMGQIGFASGEQTLCTLLGSCVGLMLYSRPHRLVGLAHIVLPDSAGKQVPLGKFADTAIPELISQLNKRAGQEVRWVAKMAGGASMFQTAQTMNIGMRNVDRCQELLRQFGIPVVATHCGGQAGRRMTISARDGSVQIEIVGQATIELK
ncbi:MAG: hypothetical protein CBB71_12750 [Rhodopirellula sp. TMED11]|nr:MAG: hypothetical protein CBB71_12750 [Rhodopirellula sp. TMED11]